MFVLLEIVHAVFLSLNKNSVFLQKNVYCLNIDLVCCSVDKVKGESQTRMRKINELDANL